MKKFMPLEVKQDLCGIVVITHGSFGEGIIQSMHMILGSVENAAFVCIEKDDADVEAYGHEIASAISAFKAGCLVLVDLIGGTPFNQFLMNVPLLDNSKCEAVCGLNLPMLLEVATSRDGTTLNELAAIALQAGNTGIFDIKEKLKKKKQKLS